MAKAEEEADWKPGSFTKNFSWGKETGLVQLYDSIRIGFAGELRDVPRDTFRQRVLVQERPDLIPVNFFLFNRPGPDGDNIVVDELVFQALTGKSGDRFDKLAIFAFNFSYAGKFRGASREQRRPALWANRYVRDRLAHGLGWDPKHVDADDIQAFVRDDPRYKAMGSRKVATNLAHLYKIGKLKDLASARVGRWWVDALFLALDRLVEDRRIDGEATPDGLLDDLLERSGFQDLAGKQSLEKKLATGHLVKLYIECGGRDRFSDEAVTERTQVRVKDMVDFTAHNSDEPVGAVHATNPRILKSIPAACAMLATYAGFEVIGPMALEDFDPVAFVKDRTRAALARLQSEGIEPSMTAEELLRLTRGG